MKVTNNHTSINKIRRAGVLLHPTSLPGRLSNGDIGHQAYRFIEFLNAQGFRVWQMLPLGPTHKDKSPYQCLSSHAGNSLLISLDWLVDKGWLEKEKAESSETTNEHRFHCLRSAGKYFHNMANDDWRQKMSDFCHRHIAWLDDYALFMALKDKFKNKAWYEWPINMRHRNLVALEAVRNELHEVINQIKFEQFVFFTQWHEIRDYAQQHDIELFGDMPIFVARDSADVWAQRDNFLMDSDGNMDVVAGVPPDAFSETGQRWGNPLYDWDYMQTTGFDWWKERFKTQLELFDIIRIDHFRGLHACWQIPESDETAIHGSWVKVPGRKLLNVLLDTFDCMPLVAEDLGVITESVIKLKQSYDLPGMKVLQFAFDGNNNNPHLPHRHETGDLVYTGTHDNDTTLGWLNNKASYNEHCLAEYLNIDHKSAEESVLSVIRAALSSVSFLCILPMQDILMLGTPARMNMPGTINDNWKWRFDWDELNEDKLQIIRRLMTLYQR